MSRTAKYGAERKRRWYLKNKERLDAKQKKWRESNPERTRELVRKWRSEHPEKVRESNRLASWAKRGIKTTPEAVDALREAQGGRCRICEIETKFLCVDWDRSTGQLRALVCKPCSTFVSRLEGNPRIVSNLLRLRSEFTVQTG